MIKVLKVCGKTSDLCCVDAVDEDGKIVIQGDGYVPAFMPGEHYGDYIELDIEVATGKILNWTVPTQAQMKQDIGRM